MDYLSENEKSLIEGFLENRPLVEAIRKVILGGVYKDGRLEADSPADPLKNFILGRMTHPLMVNAPMSEKGMTLTAIIDAVSMIETGFNELEKLRKVEAKEIIKKNPAR